MLLINLDNFTNIQMSRVKYLAAIVDAINIHFKVDKLFRPPLACLHTTKAIPRCHIWATINVEEVFNFSRDFFVETRKRTSFDMKKVGIPLESIRERQV